MRFEMLNCQQTRRQLESLDFDESAFSDPAVERHLDRCPSCQAAANEIRAVRNLLMSQPRVTTPPDFDIRLRSRLRAERNAQRPFLAWLPTPALAACAVVAALTAGYAVRTSWQSPPVAPPVANAAAPATGSTPTDLAVIAASPVAVAPSPVVNAKPVTVALRQRSAARSAPLRASAARDKVILLLRDGDDTERVIGVPPVTYGSRPVIALRNASTGESGDHSVF
jgi:predicted anti-sigma-YlaC factor YlaD